MGFIPEVIEPEAIQIEFLLFKHSRKLAHKGGFEPFVCIKIQDPFGMNVQSFTPLQFTELDFIVKQGRFVADQPQRNSLQYVHAYIECIVCTGIINNNGLINIAAMLFKRLPQIAVAFISQYYRKGERWAGSACSSCDFSKAAHFMFFKLTKLNLRDGRNLLCCLQKQLGIVKVTFTVNVIGRIVSIYI